MDAVSEIKSRLPIEDLVRSYSAITKKGRNYVALCPFHNDTRPSMLVSPDKGIAYCFPCQKGGDIFSFYQAAEGVDFIQALKDLAERTGVTLPDDRAPVQHKDEKDRARSALEHALSQFRKNLKTSEVAMQYIRKRGVTDEEIESFEMGYAPDSFSATYETLLKDGFSRTELVNAGLAIAKDLGEDRMYDRFRHRLMFPIRDLQGRIAGFGGRTLGDDSAKYMNSSEGVLFKKSELLFGLPQAREAMRETRKAVVVEGYFDVLACHRIGVTNAVATCGTAMTEQHARLLKRHVDSVVLCLDQDRAGKEAAERAFSALSKESLTVYGVTLSDKDPADAVLTDADGLKDILTNQAKPFLDIVLAQIATLTLTDPRIRREALDRLLKLLACVESSVERVHYIQKAAAAFGATVTAFEDDLAQHRRNETQALPRNSIAATVSTPDGSLFSAAELALGMMLHYPGTRTLLTEMMPPEDGLAASLYKVIGAIGNADLHFDAIEMPDDHRERAKVLQLYLEQKEMTSWGESIALREIHSNCIHANREAIRVKQQDITRRLLDARKAGNKTEEEQLQAAFKDLLRLSKSSK